MSETDIDREQVVMEFLQHPLLSVYEYAIDTIVNLRQRAQRAEGILGAFLSGFRRRGLLPEGREPLAEEAIEAVAQLFERVERAETERDVEIARVVRITERLGTETLRADRAERILDALREPSASVRREAIAWDPYRTRRMLSAIYAAVVAAEQEVDA